MLYIDSIKEIEDSHGCIVIGYLKATDQLQQQATTIYTKAEMISYINKFPNSVKTKYKRNGIWISGEYVRVVDNNYLRTDSNRILKDNLGELPRF